MTAALRMNDRGPNVSHLQTLLKKHGAHISVDGVFGHHTEVAVRQFQSKHGLVVDGVAGRRTMAALSADEQSFMQVLNGLLQEGQKLYGTLQGRMAIQQHRAPAVPTIARPATSAHSGISQRGYDFIYAHEAQRGVSERLYWPRGASGVTLGAGYDMKERTSGDIQQMMVSIGLSAAIARKVGEAAGLKDSAAQTFASDNKHLFKLTHDQEIALLRFTVPPYERIVKNKVTVSLLQHQYDALVCFAYNPGGRMNTVARLINSGETSAAMAEIKRAITSKHKVVNALVRRRDHEVALYVQGIYATSA
jgi:GH24 family phage-related lysozyme (muramidase)